MGYLGLKSKLYGCVGNSADTILNYAGVKLNAWSDILPEYSHHIIQRGKRRHDVPFDEEE